MGCHFKCVYILFCFPLKQNCCEFLLNSVWVLLSRHTTSTGFSDSELCDEKKVQNVQKPQFEHVARAQYPSQVKNCTVHVQQLSLCVKCCHICGFIRRHLATVKLVLIMPSQRKLTDFERGQAIAWLQEEVTV